MLANVRAAGGQRVSGRIAKALNRAIHAAVRQGQLVPDNPLGDSGVKPLTCRLADQPLTRLRDLGPRTLDQVPPLELAKVMQQAADECGWSDEEVVSRAGLDRYGLSRLTSNTLARLRQVSPLAPVLAHDA